MYLLLAFAYVWIAWLIPPIIPFCTINNVSISINRSNFTLVFLKTAYHDNSGVGKKKAYTFKDTNFKSF